MKKLSKILFVVFILTALMLPMLPASVNAQEIVVSSTTGGYQYGFQHKSFYAVGRYWAWFEDAANFMCFRSSTDGITWSATTQVRKVKVPGLYDPGYVNIVAGEDVFNVVSDGTYVYYVCIPFENNAIVDFRRGVLYADGTITWPVAEQTDIIAGAALNTRPMWPTVAVDSNGFPWIGVPYLSQGIIISKSSVSDGTWVIDAGFPYNLGTDMLHTTCPVAVELVPITSGKMVAIFNSFIPVPGACTSPWKIYARRWTGSAWGSVTVPTASFNVYTVSRPQYWDAVGQGDDVHIVFLENATYDIIYTKYTYSTNSFGAETTLYAGATSTSAPIITRTTDDNNLHVFWENSPVDDHIYYARYDSVATSWTELSIVDESIMDGLPADGSHLNSDYTCDSDTLGVYYIAGVSILKFKSLSSPFTVSTAAADAIGTNTATLNGSIDSLSFGAATSRGFLYGLTLEADTWSTSTPGSFGTGAFYDAISNLPSSTTFYFRAYATNSFGISYGSSLTFTTLAAGTTESVSSRAYIDITVAGNCTTDFAYLPLTITDIAHTDLIAAGYVNSSATDTRLTIFQSIFLSHLPVTDRLALVIPDFKALEVDTLRYYLGTDELQTDFDISVGYQGNITRIDTVAMRPGNNWQFDIKGFFDMSSGAVDKYVFYKPYEVQLYISAASTFTAQIGNGTDWIKTITVAGIGSGEHRVRTLSDGVDFQIYVDEVLGNSTATAAAINTAGSWLFMGNNSLCAAEYIKEDVPIGVQQLRYQPAALISGTTLIDEENGYDGNISWGANPPCVDIVVGYIASNSFIPPVDVEDPQGWHSPETDIAGWFGMCGNITGLPFYQTFHDAAEGNVTTGVTGMGMPVCSLYLMMMLGTASAVGLGLLVFTGSTVLAIIGVAVVITAGANTGVLSVWMTFVFALTAIAVVYISRQP